MKKILAFILALYLCLGLCACSGNSEPTTISTTEPTTEPTTNAIVTDEQMDAVQKSAQIHAVLDYGYTCDSITYTSCEDDGTYVTICGVVTFMDESDGQHCGDYTIVLVKDNDPENTYKVASWDLPNLEAVMDPNKDYLAEVCNYVILNGGYDSDDKRSYIEEKIAANEYYYLFAKNGKLSFWDFANYESSDIDFMLSFKCDFEKGGTCPFELSYHKYQLSNGFPYDADGTYAKISGTIKDGEIAIISEDCINCEAEDFTEDILNSYDDYTAFVESIMKKAGVNISLKQLLA